MKHWLLFAALLPCQLVAAQSSPASQPLAGLPPLPEAGMRPTVSTTVLSNAPGVRYQYQMLHFDSNCVWLAPAWRGRIKLEPRHSLFNNNYQGELEGLLVQTINEISADEWEFVEIRTESTPTGATQKTEKDSRSANPNDAAYTTTTSIYTHSQTYYLFRRALPH